METNVYLADLRYNYSGVLANDCMPLGVAYIKAVMDRDVPEVKSNLFVYPDRLWETMLQRPPDVLMLSNYCWNEALSFHFAKLARRINPNALTVMGGPNIPIEPERQLAYMEEHPEIDLYILGEGDFLASKAIQHYLDAGKSVKQMGLSEIPSSIYRRDGELIRTEMWARHPGIDDIPSPWLSGIQDEFFDGKLAPLMETNRGCPFTCTFCVQGTRWYTKVHNFSKERIHEELHYVASRIKAVSPTMGTLRIADSNYGMYERDIEISGYIGELMKSHGWPKYIDATTGKNRPERIIKSVEKVSGALVLYQAVQSMDENVLRNVKRQTIKLESYSELLLHMRGRGLRSNSDLILGLPGETISTHRDAIYRLLDTGVSQVTNFQLMMLKGSELETIETRQQFSFQTRFRVLPKNFGIYGDEKVFDIEEIVIETDSLPFDEYLNARKYALASVAFWHDDLLDDSLRFTLSHGVKRSAWLSRVMDAMESDNGVVRKFLDDFIDETRNELFLTREECIDFYSQEENFQRLLRGEIGDNLIHKYHAISTFHIWPEICQMGMDVGRELLLEAGVAQQIPDFEAFWRDFHRFVELRHAWGATAEKILSDSRDVFRYDIARWRADGLPHDIAKYRLNTPQEVEFRLSQEAMEGLSSALDVWTTDLRGLTKMVTRIKVIWQEKEPLAAGQLIAEGACA
ncbi:MAG: radical SAM protein [Terriglobia bacterium]